MRILADVALAITLAFLGVKCICYKITLMSFIWWSFDQGYHVPESKEALKPYVSKIVDHMVQDFLRCFGR